MKIKKKISKYQNVILTSEFRTAFFHDNLKLISKLLIKQQVNEGVNCTVGICQPHNKLKCSVLQFNLMYTVQTDKDKERTPTQSKQNNNNDHQGNLFCCLYGFRVPRILTSFTSRHFSRQQTWAHDWMQNRHGQNGHGEIEHQNTEAWYVACGQLGKVNNAKRNQFLPRKLVLPWKSCQLQKR